MSDYMHRYLSLIWNRLIRRVAQQGRRLINMFMQLSVTCGLYIEVHVHVVYLHLVDVMSPQSASAPVSLA